jgi:hypothetical protein
MQFLTNQSAEKHFPERETVLLKFNKKDAQIARDWSKSETKDIFDDKK